MFISIHPCPKIGTLRTVIGQGGDQRESLQQRVFCVTRSCFPGEGRGALDIDLQKCPLIGKWGKHGLWGYFWLLLSYNVCQLVILLKWHLCFFVDVLIKPSFLELIWKSFPQVYKCDGIKRNMTGKANLIFISIVSDILFISLIPDLIAVLHTWMYSS